MARRLNIDLRRKRIRHYHARRRRRSPIRRAFTFWWSTGLLVGVTLLFLAKLTLNFTFDTLGQRNAADYQLPRPSLRLVHASMQEVEDRLRMGNARRSAIAMQDSEIGISLETKLPTPPPFSGTPLPPLEGYAAGPGTTTLPDFRYLPPLTTSSPKAASCLTSVRLTDTLEGAGFTFEAQLPSPPPGEPAGRADFWVTLNEEGRVITVLRLAPTGEETAWLRTLRVFITGGKALRAAHGPLTLYWTTEESHL